MARPLTKRLNLKHDFTDLEKQEIATALARASQRKNELEEQKKQVDADLKAQIEDANSTMQREARRYNNGYEYRDVDCRIEYHVPDRGWKRATRVDTGELVWDRLMTGDEMQDNLFEPPPEEPQEITATVTYNGQSAELGSPESESLVAEMVGAALPAIHEVGSGRGPKKRNQRGGDPDVVDDEVAAGAPE